MSARTTENGRAGAEAASSDGVRGRVEASIRQRFAGTGARVFSLETFASEGLGRLSDVLFALKTLEEEGCLRATALVRCPMGHDLWAGPAHELPDDANLRCLEVDCASVTLDPEVLEALEDEENRAEVALSFELTALWRRQLEQEVGVNGAHVRNEIRPPDASARLAPHADRGSVSSGDFAPARTNDSSVGQRIRDSATARVGGESESSTRRRATGTGTDERRTVRRSSPGAKRVKGLTPEKAIPYGLAILGILLTISLSLLMEKPTGLQYFVLRVVLSLAGAGAAAVMPGLLRVDLPRSLRAGGALAVFIVIYFANPPTLPLLSENAASSHSDAVPPRPPAHEQAND